MKDIVTKLHINYAFVHTLLIDVIILANLAMISMIANIIHAKPRIMCIQATFIMQLFSKMS